MFGSYMNMNLIQGMTIWGILHKNKMFKYFISIKDKPDFIDNVLFSIFFHYRNFTRYLRSFIEIKPKSERVLKYIVWFFLLTPYILMGFIFYNVLINHYFPAIAHIIPFQQKWSLIHLYHNYYDGNIIFQRSMLHAIITILNLDQVNEFNIFYDPMSRFNYFNSHRFNLRMQPVILEYIDTYMKSDKPLNVFTYLTKSVDYMPQNLWTPNDLYQYGQVLAYQHTQPLANWVNFCTGVHKFILIYIICSIKSMFNYIPYFIYNDKNLNGSLPNDDGCNYNFYYDIVWNTAH